MLIRLHPADTVAVCRRAVRAGQRLALDGKQLTALEPIAQGHKIAIARHAPGELVVKYGHGIGLATREIPPGSHVHIHNIHTVRGRPGSAT